MKNRPSWLGLRISKDMNPISNPFSESLGWTPTFINCPLDKVIGPHPTSTPKLNIPNMIESLNIK